MPKSTGPDEPLALMFRDDGSIPNNPHLPFLVYRGAIDVAGADSPERVIESTFSANGWVDMWRNGIFPYVEAGKVLDLTPGDVAVLPAGTGHQCLWATPELCVIGAYPKRGSYDLCRGSKAENAKALKTIPEVPLPDSDPVHGKAGPLTTLWQAAPVAL